MAGVFIVDQAQFGAQCAPFFRAAFVLNLLYHIFWKSQVLKYKNAHSFFAKKKQSKKQARKKTEWDAVGRTCTRRGELPRIIDTRQGFEERSPSLRNLESDSEFLKYTAEHIVFSSRKRLFFEKKLQRFATKGQRNAGGKKPGAPLRELRAGFLCSRAVKRTDRRTVRNV